MRKIIQIAFDTYTKWSEVYDRGDVSEPYTHSDLVALCDDGTIWDWDFETRTWKIRELPQIPQGEIITVYKEK